MSMILLLDDKYLGLLYIYYYAIAHFHVISYHAIAHLHVNAHIRFDVLYNITYTFV